jgi:hypothetical protein
MQIIDFLLLSQFIPPNQTLAPIHTKSAGALAKLLRRGNRLTGCENIRGEVLGE